jgi:hypothetical protein
MKKVLLIIASLVVVLIASAIILPIIFKDKIVEIVKEEANKNVNAHINFDNDITLSLFKNFPDFTLGVNDLTIVGINEFEGDTLISLKEFRATLDIMSVISGDKIKIREILLDQPNIHAIVLKDGKANWDISKPSADTAAIETDTAATKFNIALKKFEVKNANIIYDDKSGNMYADIRNLSHTLEGDFTQDNFLMKTLTTMDALTYSMSGLTYLSNVKSSLKADIDANMLAMTFTFKENELSLNELLLSFDGSFGMKGDDMIMDMKYGVKKSDFKNFLSLIPAVYSKDFKDLQTSGKLVFDGFVKGTYNEKQMPAFALKLLVENGMFKYPALPAPVNNVQINLAITNPDGNLDNTIIDLSKMHFEVAGDGFDAKLLVTNPIKDPNIDALLKGRINLDNITKIVPLEDGMKVSGLITSDFVVKAKMSDIDAKRYESVAASGNIQAQNIQFQSRYLPQGMNLRNAVLAFSPKVVTLSDFDAKIGNSDMKMNGELQNFIPYALGKGTLIGTLDFRSNMMDANQFLAHEATPTSQPAQLDTASMEAPEIPANIDFTLKSSIGKLVYTNMEITDFKGGIHIADQKLSFNKIGLNTLGAAISMDGYYETTNPKKPTIKMDFGIEHLDIQKAFVTFNTVKKVAPIAEKTTGTFSTTFNMVTTLDGKLNPDYQTLFAEGSLLIPNAEVKGVKGFDMLANTLKYDKLKSLSLNNVRIQYKVENGRISTKPFDVAVAGQKMNLSGSTGLDQTIDYVGKIAIPRSALGSANSAIDKMMADMNKKAGTGVKLNDIINVNLTMGGTFNDPKIGTNMSDVAKNEANSLKDQAAAELAKKQKELEDKGRAEAERIKKEQEAKVKAEADRLKKEAEDKAKAESDKAKKQVEEEAKKKLKGLFGK